MGPRRLHPSRARLRGNERFGDQRIPRIGVGPTILCRDGDRRFGTDPRHRNGDDALARRRQRRARCLAVAAAVWPALTGVWSMRWTCGERPVAVAVHDETMVGGPSSRRWLSAASSGSRAVAASLVRLAYDGRRVRLLARRTGDLGRASGGGTPDLTTPARAVAKSGVGASPVGGRLIEKNKLFDVGTRGAGLVPSSRNCTPTVQELARSWRLRSRSGEVGGSFAS